MMGSPRLGEVQLRSRSDAHSTEILRAIQRRSDLGFSDRTEKLTTKQSIYLLGYLGGSSLAGLAAIHFVWRNPEVIGPFSLMIGMTPLVLLFEYSLSIPSYWSWLGFIIAGVSWLGLRKVPPSPKIITAVTLGGGLITALSFLVFILASVYYNVGAAGPVPSGWYRWVQTAVKTGEVGLVVATLGLVLRIGTNQSNSEKEMCQFYLSENRH
jgi:hypothetical protein